MPTRSGIASFGYPDSYFLDRATQKATTIKTVALPEGIFKMLPSAGPVDVPAGMAKNSKGESVQGSGVTPVQEAVLLFGNSLVDLLSPL